MSNARKLQTEIDRVMKKVDEGVELFDEIWEKVYSAEQQNQKEKYEMDLKKEIKKLQRLRDQIKSWIGSSDVKDKEPLVDARKLIETKMEAFKYCEKETKTKTYSKEGLMKAEKLTPEDIAKLETTKWISEIIEKFMEVIEERDLEVEKLSAGRGKKTNKNLIDECNNFLQMHKYHLMKLEGITRLVNNDVLDVDVVDPIREDLEYYLDSYEEEDYQQAYDEDFFYEALGLDELQVINVDHVTQAETEKLKLATQAGSDSNQSGSQSGGKGNKGNKGDKNNNNNYGAIDESDTRSKGSDKGNKKSGSGKAKSASSMVPITIGRARKGGSKSTVRTSSKRDGDDDDDDSTHGNTPTKTIRRGTLGSGPTPTTIPAVAMVSNTPGSSMAAILKRETEQQEKERQAKIVEQGRLRQQQQAQAAAALRQQQQQLQQQEQLRQQQEAQQQQLQQQRQQQEAVVAAKQQQKALQEQQQQQQQMQSQQQQMQSQQQQQAVSIAQQAQALRLQQEQLRQQHQAQQQQAAQAAQQQQQQMQSQNQNQVQNQQQQQQQVAPGSGVGQQQQQQQDANSVTPGIDIVSGLNGLGITDAGSVGSSPKRNNLSSSASVDTGRSSLIGNNNSNNTSNTNNNNAQNGSSSGVNTAINNGILQESFATLPQSNEHDRTNIRSNSYTPQNPYPATPASYPTLPNAIFENPAIFEKLGTDALFYIFYYKQGSYQQYLAARELKKQSWRFHKKYMTWFQRHEEPKVTTDEYEQGTYVYFDWETGWCTRIKQDFRFEYSFLEDTLQ